MPGRKIFTQLIQEATALRPSCRNRNDADFIAWHDKARSAVLKHIPVKGPAFEEIRFASDFFISKPLAEQVPINDNIALSCDLDDAVKLFKNILRHLEEQESIQKIQNLGTPWSEEPVDSEFNEIRQHVETSNFSSREKEEVLREIERVEHELSQAQPNWDSVKRSIKFFLDWDRELAVALVPEILNRLSDR